MPRTCREPVRRHYGGQRRSVPRWPGKSSADTLGRAAAPLSRAGRDITSLSEALAVRACRSIATIACLAAALAPAPAPAQAPQTHQHSFGDAAKWSQIFDDPQRDAWQKPHEVITA